ncbi:hypothetical protein [Chitinimonas naiadis]
MKKAKTLLAGLLLSASCLSHADAQLYYEDASARWDLTQMLLSLITGSSGQTLETTTVNFEQWAPGHTWLNDQAVLPRGALRVGFSNEPLTYRPNAHFAFVPWRQGVAPARDTLFGQFLLRQGDSRNEQRYLIIESKRPLVALGATLYNRSSSYCAAALAPRLYSGSSLDQATEITNQLSTGNVEDPACPVVAGKVDTVNAVVKKTGTTFTQSFNYAVVDLGTPQRRVLIDNIVLYFAPDAPAAQ